MRYDADDWSQPLSKVEDLYCTFTVENRPAYGFLYEFPLLCHNLNEFYVVHFWETQWLSNVRSYFVPVYLVSFLGVFAMNSVHCKK